MTNFASMFCGGCGQFLDDTHPNPCLYPHGTFCTQCGEMKHAYVCSPDPRRLEQFGFKPSTDLRPVKSPPKPLWSK